jgi:FeS assembly SUF system regulator
MLRVSKLTDYATVLMTALAQSGDELASAAALAERARLEQPTAAKVLKLLAQAGLVTSQRGTAGGYRLAHAPEAITVADIVGAIEGPFGMTECSVHSGLCDHESHCGVRGNWRRISEAVEAALRAVTLADMLVPPRPARPRIPIHVAST